MKRKQFPSAELSNGWELMWGHVKVALYPYFIKFKTIAFLEKGSHQLDKKYFQ